MNHTPDPKGFARKINPAALRATPAAPAAPTPPAPRRGAPAARPGTPAPAAPATGTPSTSAPADPAATTPMAPVDPAVASATLPSGPRPTAPATTPAPADDDTVTDEPEETPEERDERIRRETLEEIERNKLINRIKRRIRHPFGGKKEDDEEPSKFRKFLKKFFKFAFVLLLIYAIIQIWHPFGIGEDASTGSNGSSGSGIGESTISDGIRPKSGMRADQQFPKLAIKGDTKVLTFEDPTTQASDNMTFQVVIDDENNILTVKPAENLYKNGYVKFGTTNGSDKTVGYCKESSCDFTDKQINICTTWIYEQNQINTASGGNYSARFWSARELDQAVTDDSSAKLYPGNDGGNSRLCGGKY